MFKIIGFLLVAGTLCAMDHEQTKLPTYGDTPKPELVDIKGLDKEEVLKALYNKAKPYDTLDNLDEKYIQMAKNKKWEVGRLKNKTLFVDLSSNRFDAGRYNQENGENAAQEAIEQLKKQKSNQSVDKK